LPVAIQRNTDLTALLGLEFVPVQFDGVGMGQNNTVTDTEAGMSARNQW
jgi:hypothetical protein